MPRPELRKSRPFGEPQFLVGHEYESFGIVSCPRSQEISFELGAHRCKGLLTSREVHSAHEPSTRSRAGDVLAAVRSTEGMAGIDVLESLSMQYLGSEPFGRTLARGPHQQPMPRFVPPHIHW
jgi:hypothetical protein